MTDELVAAEPIEDASPVEQPQADAPQTQAKPKLEHTPADAIDRAFAKLEKQEAETASKVKTEQPEKAEKVEKTEAKEPAEKEPAKAKAEKPDDGKEDVSRRPRDAEGKFVSKDAAADEAKHEDAEKPNAEKQAGFSDAPSRFSPDAKEAWKDAPEPVKAEITRAVREMEQGIEQYRQAYEPFREFHKELQQNGQNFKDVVAHYTGIENLLKQDPLAGLNRICENMGMSLRDVAAHVMNQTPDQVTQQTDSTIRELRQELAALKQQIGGVSETMETQRMTAAEREIAEFTAQPGHERFEELADDIVFMVETGRAKDLQQAYELAARLNPAPDQIAPTTQVQEEKPEPTADLTAQTRKGSLSVAGSPASGSNPGTKKKPAASAQEAVDRAFASMSL